MPPVARTAAVFLAFLAVVIVLQLASGAYKSEFSGYPDEPAHYVTSLMVRDYIVNLKPVPPVEFAVSYYNHYPKVALGHWPPFFYIVQALWMLIFTASRASVRLEMAFTTALLAYAVYSEARRWFAWKPALLAGFLTVCLPIVQTYTDEEMSDTLLTLLCFSSAVYFGRYIDSQRWRDSLLFATFFSLAVLTKGNGWLLALLPAFALPLTRKLRLILQPSFWGALALVAILCLPWQLMTMEVVERGWTGGSEPSSYYALNASIAFLRILAGITGPALSLLVAIGITITVFAPMLRKPAASTPAVMAALLFAVWVFHSIVPAGVEDRKMLIAAPALILFLFAGGLWVADRLPLTGKLFHWRRALAAITGAMVFSGQTFAIPRQTHYGYAEAATFITSRASLRGSRILVSSGSGGEGLLVSEIAMHEAHPTDVVIRATKALAKVDWNADASTYQSFFSTPAQIDEYLERCRIDLVVLDSFPPAVRFLHDQLLREAIQTSPHAHLIACFHGNSPGAKGQIQVYQIDHSQN